MQNETIQIAHEAKLRKTGMARDCQKLKTDCCYINQHLVAPDVMCLRFIQKYRRTKASLMWNFLRLGKNSVKKQKQSRDGKVFHF